MIVERSFHKFTPDQIREIRSECCLFVPGKTTRDIAKKYGVGKNTIWRIMAGKTYREIN